MEFKSIDDLSKKIAVQGTEKIPVSSTEYVDTEQIKEYVSDTDTLHEKLSNKQNSLAADGTGAKYPTVDAVNEGLNTKTNNTDVISNERTLAEAINQLNARVTSLEMFLQNPIFDNIQSETVSAVSSLQFKGAELILKGAGAPVVVPDFIGQIYIKTDATVAVYIATGVATSGDWKSV